MLAGSRLGDEARLAHAPRQKRLADGVVDLVRSSVGQVLAFEIKLDAEFRPQTLGARQGGGSTDERRELPGQLPPESGIVAGGEIGGLKPQERLDERLRHETSAVLAEITVLGTHV